MSRRHVTATELAALVARRRVVRINPTLAASSWPTGWPLGSSRSRSRTVPADNVGDGDVCGWAGEDGAA